ncbi:acetyl-CoA C-acetyltransferase [Aggregicoccus sp. 17bor-14]|uniref:acetyl-CoA C-acetyltransferase n=1 Tax=Myxococcaceae TaxID=31 RepID=UPI00129CC258|nr:MULTISPECIES: acetyl-CoA C-acetyltransferase [Myxococcaceae]MBF5045650.1 acetyl-CoA C-acetyltransferase [Simulacricoccus sp. 17bor-14]MRI91387.1 acetyl-CoA C-acetyltransferase [Aggregicoccus sp. 17bor-14]
MGKAVILEAVRTPRGRGKVGKGALSGLHPQELLAQAMNGLVERTGVAPADVEDVVAGCVSQVGEQGANLARNAVLAAGWPQEVTGVTLNRFCGSGLQAVATAAYGVASGFQHLVLAGGVESMSRVPMSSDGGGQDGGNVRLRERVFQVPQGISADLIATREGFSRAELDAFALRSHQRAAQAMERGLFTRSLVPVKDPATGSVVLSRDELPRPDTTLEKLAALPASFVEPGRTRVPDGRTLDEVALAAYPDARALQHLHTAGNSSPLTDGAAAVLLASEDYARAHGLRPRAHVRAIATAGAEPLLMLTAPAPASRRALQQAGMQVGDIDLWEINEAFSAVPLETMRRLGLDPERVNVNGGAIALGHPLGATGAMLLGTVLDELERRDLATGLVTLCISGGQAVAMIVERS